MRLLAIDTAADLCAACVWDTEAGERGRCTLELGKGHAERLMAVIDEALAKAGSTYADLGAIVVAVGPGSFTGVRVGVAAARGLALALGVPAVGVTTLEALARQAREESPGRPALARIEAGRGQAYVAAFSAAGELTFGPAALALAAADTLIRDRRDILLAAGKTADIAIYARCGAEKLAAGAPPAKPKPLYLREADAKPQEGFALPRKALP
ncbi:MAG: tRNA (adenosine(37)-N6)-threonylcarbamoyltransferase complex dimerization subunit type 1 TsaB [Aquamicrobium sp.]|uniref:tRNA (adenosine(37)-N6)-threonylcarbamoyltransferase complex dimerization subunit type 1 TsaB n=1 Tax=Aquamicrobium sp. TaxID=1872579 RepID=UPI00349EB519|nr:tRNA (adenosine(37)-N6)-threonylcarbamoyltransferase complex dimerization subunit type 1 TsaB [Aquamicrobium sp.]